MLISSAAFYGMAFRVPVVSAIQRSVLITKRFNADVELAKTPVPHLDCVHHYLCYPLILCHGRQ